MIPTRATVLLLLGIQLGCVPDDQRTESVDLDAVAGALGEAAAARLDSANTAYRAGSYDRAASLYEAVIEAEPDRPEGWFGLYMAERARGDLEAAEAALERARAVAPGASLLRRNGERAP